MTVKCFRIIPKITEGKLERIDIESEFTYEGKEVKEKYLVMYSIFPEVYRIYTVSGGEELTKKEVDAVLRQYIFKVTKGDVIEHREMTIEPHSIQGHKMYKEI